MARAPLCRPIAIVFVLALAAASNASLVLTTRWGQLSSNYTYGQNPDIRTGSDAWSSESLTSEFAGHIFDASSGEGNGPHGAWQAGITYDLAQSFSQSPTGFAGTGTTTLTSFLVGSGFSNVTTGLPGNNLLVIFENTSTVDYVLTGAVSSQANLVFQRHNGSQWEDVFTTSGPGAFNATGSMTAGSYLIQAIGTGTSSGNGSSSLSWNYSFSAVPEPASIVVLTLGLVPLLRRRRRRVD